MINEKSTRDLEQESIPQRVPSPPGSASGALSLSNIFGQGFNLGGGQGLGLLGN